MPDYHDRSRWRPGVVALLSALAASALLGACSGGGAPSPGPSAQAPPDAPADWDQFLDWADKEILKAPAPTSAPEQRSTPTRTPVIQLDEMLAGRAAARGAGDAAAPSDVLLSLGPFRSDQAAKGLKVGRLDDPVRPATVMKISDFEVRAEDVGAILLDLRQPSGPTVTVSWSLVGVIRAPVPDNEHFWKLKIDTEGLPDWRGSIQKLQVIADGPDRGDFEIRSLRFLGRKTAYPQRAGARRADVDHELRSALYVHCPGEVELGEVTLPGHARFTTGLALAMAAGAPATLEVIAASGGEKRRVVSESVSAGAPWRDVGADLSDWGGRRVRLSLACRGGGRDAVGLWGSPVFYEPVDSPTVFIIYLIDAVGSRRLNLYGEQRETAPRIARLASEGVWFTNAFANASRTVESVPDLLLSLSSMRHGVQQPSLRAPVELAPLPAVLAAAGFATGFYCTNPNAGVQQNLDQGFDSFFERYAYFYRGDQGGTLAAGEVLDWLDRHRDRPAFLYIHTVEPHSPYWPPPGFAGRFDPDYHGSFDGGFDANHGFEKAREPRDIAHIIALQEEEIAFADAQFGRLIDGLQERGLRGRTNVFVTADHGEEFFEHGFWEHGLSLHDAALRIPLVAAGPLIAARGQLDTPVQLMDLMPTILELAGAPAPYALEGESLAPLLAGADPNGAARLKDRLLYAANFQFRSDGSHEEAIIEGGRYKLLFRFADWVSSSGQTRFQLFDLARDREERQDLLDEQPERARRLIGLLVEHHRREAPIASRTAAGPLQFDRDQLERLKSLGYLK